MTRRAGAVTASVVLAGLLRTAALPAQSPPPWGGLEPGPHAVGHRRMDAAGGRLDIWFPARSGEPALPRSRPTVPVVLYAGPPGPFAEYLASHGYAVVGVPSGAGGLAAAAAALRDLHWARSDSLGVVAWGAGWGDAVAFAEGHRAVRAILALDPPRDAVEKSRPARTLAVLILRTQPAKPQSAHFVTVMHRRLLGGVAHAFFDGALRAWGPSLSDLATQLSRAGLTTIVPP